MIFAGDSLSLAWVGIGKLHLHIVPPKCYQCYHSSSWGSLLSFFAESSYLSVARYPKLPILSKSAPIIHEQERKHQGHQLSSHVTSNLGHWFKDKKSPQQFVVET